MNNFKFAFFGTPGIAKETLDILFSNGYKPAIIITSPDALSGRGMKLHESQVSLWAKENNIRCLKPEKIKQEFIDELSKENIDLSIVVAYGKILPEALINIPSLGTINIHYSLLPQYRGASPLESSLLNGDEMTGVSIQQMRYKLDSGPILASESIKIDINDTKENLRNKLIKLGADLLYQILPKIINKNITTTEQDETKATYCTKINKEAGEINLNDQALVNYHKYRAFYGWPGIYFFKEKNKKMIRIKITKARYENNSFVIERVIPEGKKEIDYKDFLNQTNTSK